MPRCSKRCANCPGLTVLLPGVTAPPVDAIHPADYLLTVTGLQVHNDGLR